MVKRRRGRRIAIGAGVAVVLVLTVPLALKHREILVHFELQKLQSVPEYLKKCLAAPEGTVVHEAVEEYLTTETGRKQYLHVIVDWIVAHLPEGSSASSFLSLERNERVLIHISEPRRRRRSRPPPDDIRQGNLIFGLTKQPMDRWGPRRYEQLQITQELGTMDRLERIVGTQVEFSEYPRLVFAVLRKLDKRDVHLRISPPNQRIDAPEILLEDLKVGPDQNRILAIDNLWFLGESAIPTLQKGLKDPETRFECAKILVEAEDPRSRDAVPVLAAVLRDDPDKEKRRQAVFALGRGAARNPEAIPILTEALQDYSSNVVIEALRAIGRRGQEAESAVPAVTELLKTHWNADIRALSASCLGAIGSSTRSVVAALERAVVEDSSPNVQKVAKTTLTKISGQ